jgi:hypothetical protein
MANNCLVTKLKAVVDNDNLLKLGELRLKVVTTAANQEVGLVGSVFNDISVVGNTTEISPSNPSSYTGWIKIATPGTHILSIMNKYNLTKITCYGSALALVGGFDDIKYISGLDELNLGSEDIDAGITDVALLANLPALSNIRIWDKNMVGNISSLLNTHWNVITALCVKSSYVEQGLWNLGYFKTLTTLNMGNTLRADIKGSIESFVTSKRETGETTGSFTQRYLGANRKVTWKSEVIGNVENNNISWTATTITYNGETITA